MDTTTATATAPLWTLMVNDPSDPMWSQWHGFANRRWVDGYKSERAARAAVARAQAGHGRIEFRVIDPEGNQRGDTIPSHAAAKAAAKS